MQFTQMFVTAICVLFSVIEYYLQWMLFCNVLHQPTKRAIGVRLTMPSSGLLVTDRNLYRPTDISTDSSSDYRPTLNRCIVQLSSDYRLSVDQPSTECRPITGRYIGQVSVKYRPIMGQKSAKCRPSVGEVSVT